MYELRVLSGLYQGASLPLIGEHWTVGASEADDLAIFEPNIPDGALAISRVDDHWHANGEPLSVEHPLQLGHVWLMICHATTPWSDFVPPGSDPTPALANSNTNSTENTPNSPAQALAAISRSHRLSKILLWVLAFIGTLAVTVSTWAINPQGHSSATQSEALSADVTETEKLPLQDADLARNILLHMLKNRELNGIVIAINDTNIQLQGSLVTEDELQRLGRMLTRFSAKYHSPLPVVNAVKQRQFTLPFRIQQVTTGPMAHLVTNDGNRLFIGDEVDGVRLLAIDEHRIRFGGKFQLEMTW